MLGVPQVIGKDISEALISEYQNSSLTNLSFLWPTIYVAAFVKWLKTFSARPDSIRL
jgi:hypothetical protein